jgi:tetratricopeptide (TPR) repeat protein
MEIEITGRSDALLQRAMALHQSGRLQEAIETYEKVVATNPLAAGVLNLLGIARFQSGDLPKAATALRRALTLNPELPNAHYNLGRVLQGLRQHNDALVQYELALSRAPHDAAIASNIGTVLAALGRHEEALRAYRGAVAANPKHWEAWLNLANGETALARYSRAAAAFSRAIELRPNHVEGLCTFGFVLSCLDQHEQAIKQLQHAIDLDPNCLAAHINLGHALSAVGRDEEAIHSYDRALLLKPEDADARYGKCLRYLERGRFVEGWRLFDSRWKMQWASPHRGYKYRCWDGAQVAGPLLVWGEQGIGDQILFASMLDDVRAHADSLVVEVDQRLVPLLARSFPSIQVVGVRSELLHEFSAQTPLGDLGLHVRHDLASFERSANGYLRVNPALAGALRQRLSPDGRRVIGVSWRSTNKYSSGAKSSRLADFTALLGIRDWRFVDLQYGDTSAERDDLQQRYGIEIIRLPDVDTTNDIDGLAALIAACDAVFSVSNTTVHLAGAQGKPTWVLLPFAFGRHWYWQYSGRETPFYKSVRLCRKKKGQSWADLARSAADELRMHLEG